MLPLPRVHELISQTTNLKLKKTLLLFVHASVSSLVAKSKRLRFDQGSLGECGLTDSPGPLQRGPEWQESQTTAALIKEEVAQLIHMGSLDDGKQKLRFLHSAFKFLKLAISNGLLSLADVEVVLDCCIKVLQLIVGSRDAA